jgi:hypothetical protein
MPWDNALPDSLQGCLYMFEKIVFIGLPSSWTRGLCRALQLGVLLDLQVLLKFAFDAYLRIKYGLLLYLLLIKQHLL